MTAAGRPADRDLAEICISDLAADLAADTYVPLHIISLSGA